MYRVFIIVVMVLVPWTVEAAPPVRNTKHFNTHHERVVPSEIREGQPIMITCVIRDTSLTNISLIQNCVSSTNNSILLSPWPTDKGYIFQIETRDGGRRFNISISQTDTDIHKCVSEYPAIREEVYNHTRTRQAAHNFIWAKKT